MNKEDIIISLDTYPGTRTLTYKSQCLASKIKLIDKYRNKIIPVIYDQENDKLHCMRTTKKRDLAYVGEYPLNIPTNEQKTKKISRDNR